MTSTTFIQQHLNITDKSIATTIKLLSEDCTIPFISRYRKDATGNLDETQIEKISKLNRQFEEIIKRKETILKSVEEQNSLTEDLKQRIENSFSLQEIEDLYLPFKKRKKTKADTAKEKGLEPLAKIIMSKKSDDLQFLASKYRIEIEETENTAVEENQVEENPTEQQEIVEDNSIDDDTWEDNPLFVIEAKVPLSEIDIKQTIIQNLSFPNEHEINVKEKGRNVEIIKIYELE